MCVLAKSHISLLWSFKVVWGLGSINIWSLRDREPERWKTMGLLARDNPSSDLTDIPLSLLLPQRFFQFSFSGPESEQCLLILIVSICQPSLRLQDFRYQTSLDFVP